MPTQKSLNKLLAFLNLHQHVKNHFIPSAHSQDTVNVRVSWPVWHYPFLTMANQKFVDKALIYVNLYQHEKNQNILLTYSEDMVD